MFVANVFGANFSRSFWSNYERMEGFVTILHLLGYFVVLGSVMNRKLWDYFINTSVGASAVMGIYGIFQLSGALTINQGGVRVDGTFGNATYLAVYMLFHIFLTTFLLIRHRGASWVKLMYGAVIIIQGYILFQTATRGAILGLVGGVFLAALLIAIFERNRLRLRKTAVGVVIITIVIVSGFFVVRNTQLVEQSLSLKRIADISLEDKTTQSRFIIWGMALEGFKESHMLGWGQENFNLIFNKYYKPELFTQEQWFDRAHSVFLDWLTAGGILGLLAYLSIFTASIFLIWRRSSFDTTERSIITGLLAAYFFHNLFVFDNVISYMFFGTVLALIHTNSKSETKKELRVISTGLVNRVLAPFVAVALIVTVYFFNVPGVRASRALIGALQAQGTDINMSFDLFDKSLSLSAYGRPETREQLVNITTRLGGSDVPQDIKVKFFERTKLEMEAQVQQAPDDARHYLFLGSFLSRFGFFEEAQIHLEKAMELSPKKQTIRFAVVDNLIRLGKNDEALALAKETFELAPEIAGVRRFYGLIAIRFGRDSLAEKILVPEFGTVLIPEPEFINAYLARGDLHSAAFLWGKRVEADPDNTQIRFSYSSTLAQLGRIEEAVKQIEEIITRDPFFEEQGRQLIERIRSGQF